MSGYAQGSRAKAQCPVCGIVTKYQDLVRDWRGVWVCPECDDPQHPQELPPVHLSDAVKLHHPAPLLDKDLTVVTGYSGFYDTDSGISIAATFDVGNAKAVGAAAPDGERATYSLGTVTLHADATITPDGEAGTFALGTITPVGLFDPSAEAGTFDVGTPTGVGMFDPGSAAGTFAVGTASAIALEGFGRSTFGSGRFGY